MSSGNLQTYHLITAENKKILRSEGAYHLKVFRNGDLLLAFEITNSSRPEYTNLCPTQSFCSNTATCAIAALSVPMPSGVLALIPTWSGLISSNSATCF
jgi:hypothetical protein